MRLGIVGSEAARARVVVEPLRWADVDFPQWTWGFLMSRELMEDISEGERLPPGYGIAYWDLDRDVAVCMVVPLNAIYGALRFAWRWLRFPPWRRGVYKDRADRRTAMAERYAVKQYDAGKRDGFAEGLDAGYVRGWNDHVDNEGVALARFRAGLVSK